MAELHTLTLEEINATPELRDQGALAGDQIADGEFVRVFSKEADTLGHLITQDDIGSTPELVDMKAEVGDRIVEGELVRVGQDSAWTAFKYGKAKGEEEGIIDYATEALEAHFPTVGRVIDYSLDAIATNLFPNPFEAFDSKDQMKKRLSKGYESPDEKYGEGFTAAEPQVRREMMMREKERALQQEFKGFNPDEAGGVSKFMGEMYGTLKDPTSLLPAGRGIKAMVGIGAAMGGGFSATQDLAQKGEVDPLKAGLFAAGGAALPLGFLGAKVGGAKAYQGVSSLYTNKTSAKVVNRANAYIAKEQAGGKILTENNLGEVAEAIGVSANRLESSFSSQSVKPRFHSSVDEAEKALQASIAEDSGMLRTLSKGADKYLGAISTRLKNVDEGLYGRLIKTEFGMHKNTQEYLKRVDPFLQGISKIPEKGKEELNFLISTGKHAEADDWLRSRGMDDVADSFGEVKVVIGEIGETAKTFGYKADVENYYPRSVRDHSKLMSALGAEEGQVLEKALRKAAEAKGVSVSKLTQNQRDRVIEKVTLGKAGGTVGTKKERIKIALEEAQAAKAAKGFKGNLNAKERAAVTKRILTQQTPAGDKGAPQFKQRTMDDSLTVELMPQYKSPEEALQAYIRTSVNNFERKTFFQGSSVVDLDGEVHIDKSIDKLILDMKATKGMDNKAEQEIRDIVTARFGADNNTMNSTLTGVKNLGYIGTLGDFMSTLTQVADIPNVMGYHGFKNTIKAAFGPKSVSMDDVGVSDIARELGDSGFGSKVLGGLLEKTGFKRIDRFGKETLMTAVKNKYTKQLGKKEGVDRFKKKWGDVYGPDIDQVVLDLQSGAKTELSNLHYFTKLSEHQPISYSEYPQGYLEGGNSRILYMLKSFTMKQWDLARRNLVGDMKKATTRKEYTKAALKIGKVGAFLAAGGLGVDKTKDFILGRDIKPEELGTDAMWSLAGVYGLGKYVGEKNLLKGDLVGLGTSLLQVPTPALEGVQKLLTGDVKAAAKHIPIIGRTLDSRFLGGAEKYNKKNRKKIQ